VGVSRTANASAALKESGSANAVLTRLASPSSVVTQHNGNRLKRSADWEIRMFPTPYATAHIKQAKSGLMAPDIRTDV